ncbi:MAG: aminoacyl-tRNA hydrolase [Firmicutes bacterium]|nr:aminoacyl-tRNA hydrolase [Bacillota bacterium]
MGQIDYLVVGLGNPGIKYSLTRHNAGFLVLDQLARKQQIKFTRKGEKARTGQIKIGERLVLLVKPLTFMNLSGEAVKILLERYQLPLDRVIIISDDVALPFGYLRLKPKGSSGGHKGLASIIAQIGQDFPRLRVGIGSPPPEEVMSEYVLARFTPHEEKLLPLILDEAAQALTMWVEEGIEKAMSVYNGPVRAVQNGLKP